MKPDFLYAFDKVVKTIKSCENLDQLEVAGKMLYSFEDMFAKEICNKTKQIYFTTLDDLIFKKQINLGEHLTDKLIVDKLK